MSGHHAFSSIDSVEEHRIFLYNCKFNAILFFKCDGSKNVNLKTNSYFFDWTKVVQGSTLTTSTSERRLKVRTLHSVRPPPFE